MRAFWIRLTHWEYWPFEIVYLPIFAYWLYLSCKARSFLYFTASNTLMENGGMLGESKIGILEQIPQKYLPKTLLISKSMDNAEIQNLFAENNFHYPVIVKPNIGERGVGVEKIKSAEDLSRYHLNANYSYLIQEYLDLPLETGVFYYRFPSASGGRISSLVYKELLSVRGDGKRTLKDLIYARDRAYLQRDALQNRFHREWDSIVDDNHTVILETIGNHSRGTKFLNGNVHITPALLKHFDTLADALPGFYFGRFDIRSASWEALQSGDFMIMELNGAGSEPAHIYDPSVSISSAYSSLFLHWKVLYKISIENHKRGIPYLSLKQGMRAYKKVLDNKRLTVKK